MMAATAASNGLDFRGYNHDDDGSVPEGKEVTVHELMIQGSTTGSTTPIITATKKGVKIRRSQATGVPRARTGTNNQQNNPSHEQHPLQEENDRLRHELTCVHEEKQELETAFRRLDQEIGNGYNLVERTEKETKINELMAKNQKMASVLEKELQTHEALRMANVDLIQQIQRQHDQLTIVNQVLTSVETKYEALVASHQQLTGQHANAQSRIVTMQEQLHGLETQAINSSSGQRQHMTQYEEKIRSLEIQYRDAQSRLEDKTQQWRAEQEQNRVLQIEIEHHLETRDRLEKEMANVHDQMIHMSGSMRAMEARVEATIPASQSAHMIETFKQRIRALEEELVAKNRQISDLMQTVDGVLNSKHHSTARGQRKSSIQLQRRSTTAPANTKMTLLMQKLHAMESSRDHKTRCLSVLLDAFPVLLQRLDGLYDQLQAATESNSILSHAIEQLQQSSTSEQHDETFLALARDSFALNLPYQHDILMGYTASRAFTENATRTPPPPRHFAPFQAVGVTPNDPQTPFILVAEKDDPNGAIFLHRSKINTFLQVIQGKTMPKAKFQALLINKFGDVLSRQRELLHQQSSESTFYKTTVHLLEREVEQLKRKLQTQSVIDTMVSHTNGDMRSRALVIKLIEHLCQQQHQRQETFLTQPHAFSRHDPSSTRGSTIGMQDPRVTEEGVELDLSHCYLCDDDLEPILLKIAVSGVRLQTIRLDGNAFTDNGAAALAAFLETCLPPLQSISIVENESITLYGMQRIHDALLRNALVQRVDSDKHDGMVVLNGLAAQREFDVTGLPTTILQVVMSNVDESKMQGADDDGEETIQRLQAAGLCAGAPRPLSATLSRAVAGYTRTTPASTSAGKRRPRSAPSIVTNTTTMSSGNTRSATITAVEKRSLHQRQKELKFRALEAAIQRAERTTMSTQPQHDGEKDRPTKGRALTLAQMQYLLNKPKCSSSARHTKLRFAQSHLATVRGLKR